MKANDGRCATCRKGHYAMLDGSITNYPCANEDCTCFICHWPDPLPVFQKKGTDKVNEFLNHIEQALLRHQDGPYLVSDSEIQDGELMVALSDEQAGTHFDIVVRVEVL